MVDEKEEHRGKGSEGEARAEEKGYPDTQRNWKK